MGSSNNSKKWRYWARTISTCDMFFSVIEMAMRLFILACAVNKVFIDYNDREKAVMGSFSEGRGVCAVAAWVIIGAGAFLGVLLVLLQIWLAAQLKRSTYNERHTVEATELVKIWLIFSSAIMTVTIIGLMVQARYIETLVTLVVRMIFIFVAVKHYKELKSREQQQWEEQQQQQQQARQE